MIGSVCLLYAVEIMLLPSKTPIILTVYTLPEKSHISLHMVPLILFCSRRCN